MRLGCFSHCVRLRTYALHPPVYASAYVQSALTKEWVYGGSKWFYRSLAIFQSMSPHTITAHADVIDHIAKPTFVFDSDRKIHACNRAGKAMLATPLSPVNVVSGVLYGADTGVDKAIAFQSFAITQWPELAFSDQFSPVSEPMRVQWIAVSVSCLQTARPEHYARRIRYLLLTVHPVLVHCDVDPALLQAALGLSRSEARISALIYAGLGLREVAIKMGIGQSTVKTHLQGVFSKVNISKQTELVKLVASLA